MITETTGNLFDAPDGTALLHACNCQGVWGKGIAEQFKKLYPAAFTIYRQHCLKYLKDNDHHTVQGRALIIPPQAEDVAAGRRHPIICLMTSWHFGRRRSTLDKILENTQGALAELKVQVDSRAGDDAGDGWNGEIWSCRINAGCFGVPWEQTRRMMEESGVDMRIINVKT